MNKKNYIGQVLGLDKLFTPYTSRLTFNALRFTVHASRSLLRFTPYALLITVFALLFALCSLPRVTMPNMMIVLK